MSTTPTRPLPSAVRDKLGKLLPMLSSDHDGERVGAVAAIERTLRSSGCDWHDLAASIASPAPVRESPRQRRRAPDDDTSATMDAGELIDLIAAVRDQRRLDRAELRTISRRAARTRRRLCVRFHQSQATTLARRSRP
jgi:hypothetical protein